MPLPLLPLVLGLPVLAICSAEILNPNKTCIPHACPEHGQRGCARGTTGMPLPLIPLVLGLPVLAICSAVAHVTGQDWPKLRNMFYFPLGGTTRGSHHATQRQRLLQRLGGTNLRLVTRDNRAVSAVYAEPDRPVRTDVAVILIGANAMVLDDMVEYAEFYLHRLRVPVLMLSLWGYPDPINPAIDSSAAAAEERSIPLPQRRC
ncbi:hypothetical protein T492DRAFT_841451 [Pavlovales sp. CCMP2436]|nr:hypothetical protein T492DRAFT_841451 [Pavlovales sp. CCMP2436]